MTHLRASASCLARSTSARPGVGPWPCAEGSRPRCCIGIPSASNSSGTAIQHQMGHAPAGRTGESTRPGTPSVSWARDWPREVTSEGGCVGREITIGYDDRRHDVFSMSLRRLQACRQDTGFRLSQRCSETRKPMFRPH